MRQLAMASMAGMETGPEGQPIDVMQAQGKFKVRLFTDKHFFFKLKVANRPRHEEH
jgi:hypothetical protein